MFSMNRVSAYYWHSSLYRKQLAIKKRWKPWNCNALNLLPKTTPTPHWQGGGQG